MVNKGAQEERDSTKKGGLEMEKKMKVEAIELKQEKPKVWTVTIEGDGDLVLNKMNDRNTRDLTRERKNKGKDTSVSNPWEDIITAIHWYNGKPTDFSEEGLRDALKNNAPCITAFGLKKSFRDAVNRFGVDKNGTRFDASVNIVAKGGLVPVQFVEHYIDEKLMSPRMGKPVLARLNRFSGWRAQFTIMSMESVFSMEQIVNIINLAGFGIGIGSGRSSGYGRYHVVGVA